MLLIDQQDLEARGIECQGVSEFIFLDKYFQKDQTFELHQRKTAITTCRQMLDAGLMSLIVNYQSYFTIWVERKAVTDQLPQLTQSVERQDDNSAVEDLSEVSWSYRQIFAKLNEPLDMRAVMAKLNEPISFGAIFSNVKDSQS